MAQLRQDFTKFEAVNTAILVVGPENAAAFAEYWREHGLPFTGLPDPKHSVLKLYGQEVNLFKLGRMPAQVIIDKSGTARYVHYGKSMSDIPENEELLEILHELDQPVSALT
jgi:peroxiredoxin Q/BCP